ncbi:hypothetical protein BOX15_Mlig003913g1 [Macrostomum lignano]|nr:hypothetical protein BOX15_Mlig003913g1 [Macrostomum lignano]
MGGKPSKLDRTDGARKKKDKKKNEDKKPSSKQQEAPVENNEPCQTVTNPPSEPEPSVEPTVRPRLRRVPMPTPASLVEQQEESPSPMQQRMYRALYDFDGQEEGDLTFRRGEVIMVMQPGDDSSAKGRWLKGWVAGDDTREGFVPGNFLADLPPDDPKLLPGYYNYGRPDAEKELVRAAHPVGSYIVRPCGNNSDSLALSVKYKHLDAFKIYHYKIKKDPAGGGLVFISNSKKFPTVSELIEYYKGESGLVCKLSAPVDTNTKPVVPFRELFIHQQKIKCTTKLGSGSFGVVFQGKLLEKIDVAVKQLKMGSDLSTESSLIEEAQTQYRLSHRNVIQLIGYSQTDKGEFWLIMEFAEKGSLHSQLTSTQLPFRQQIDYIRQVSNGMAYLEKEQVVHRDLRAANILLTDKDELKIADFGLARVIEKSDSLYTVEAGVYRGDQECRFPIRWTAPEGINKHEFSVKSDVWSFGVCAYEIVTGGRKPYQDRNNQQVTEFVNSGQRLENPLDNRFDRDDPRSQQAKFLYEEVLLYCWRTRPEDRPTFASLSATFEDFENTVSSRYNMYD